MSDAGTRSRSADEIRTARILAAAEHQFLTYGMRRTSMDDIAREADLAKGTLYLSFKSKKELFAALAQRIVDRFRALAVEAAEGETDPVEKIVAYLDGAVGEPGRLLASTPHVGEVLDAKRALAASTIERFQEQVLLDVARISGRGEDMAVMLIEAAHGCKATGSLSPHAFKARLSRHVETLLRGADRTGSGQSE